MPRTTWEILNSPLISNIVGGLVIGLLVGLAITWVSSHWEQDRARGQVQWETFRGFNTAAADLITRSADVYQRRGQVPDAEYQQAYRELAHRKLTFLQMDAEVAGAFRDQSLFEDFLRVKQHADSFSNAITQQPAKAPLEALERGQNHFLWETKIMKLKMFHEMGLLAGKEFKEGVAIYERRLADTAQ